MWINLIALHRVLSPQLKDKLAQRKERKILLNTFLNRVDRLSRRVEAVIAEKGGQKSC